MALTTMVLIACNKKAGENGHDHNDGSHQHANGEEHIDHNGKVKQEEFTVPADSSASQEAQGPHETDVQHQH